MTTNQNLTLRQLCLTSPRIHEVDFSEFKKEMGAIEIHKMEDYFWHFINNQIHVEDSDSIIAYLCGISNKKPSKKLEYIGGSSPDVDSDLDPERREDLMNYLRGKYGVNNIANIGTYNYMYAKSAVRMVGKALGYELELTDSIAKMIPDPVQGRNWSIDDAIEESSELAELEKNDDRVADILKWARKLEGIISSKSKHAAGVIIADEPIDTTMALWKDGDQAVSEFDMKEVENVGYVKADLLSLKTLSIIKETIKQIKERHSIDIDLKTLNLEDKNIYKLLSTGNLLGIFQLEGKGISDFTKTFRPTKFDDIVLISAGYRPGPIGFMASISRIKNKNGEPDVKPHSERFPLLKPFLENTYGYLLFQEQISRMVEVLAGYNDSEADEFRKIIGKKLRDKMLLEKARFMPKLLSKGMAEKDAEQLWDELVEFSSYSFNLSHAVSYSILTAQTVWLKTYYPIEFFTANILFELDDVNKIMQLIVEAKKFHINILQPDINISNNNFSIVDDNTIRFGLSGIVSVGNSANAFIEERKNGNYTSISNFILRTNPRSNVLHNIIKAGGFDSIINRSQLLEPYDDSNTKLDKIMDYLKWYKDKDYQVFDIKEELIDLDLVCEYPIETRVELEAEITNLWLSEHPFNIYADEIEAFKKKNTGAFIGFIVNHKKFKNTDGATFVLQDEQNNEKQFFIFKDLWNKSIKTEKKFKEYYSYIVGIKSTRTLKDDPDKRIVDNIEIISSGSRTRLYPRRLMLDLNNQLVDKIEDIQKINVGSNNYMEIILKHKDINFNFVINK